jgi:hypothetical protein
MPLAEDQRLLYDQAHKHTHTGLSLTLRDFHEASCYFRVVKLSIMGQLFEGQLSNFIT